MKPRYRIALLLLLSPFFLAALFYRSDLPVEELRERYTDDASRFFEHEGLSLHYKDEGSGPALLLLHGTASSLHTWDGWVEILRDEFRVVRLDLPNFGLTGPPPGGAATLEDQFTTLDALLDHLGLERAAVAGNSLGGLIAWRYAAHAPDRVTHLLLIDSAGAPPAAAVEPRSSIFDLARKPVIGPLLAHITPRFLVRDGL
jgi:pimeloyl-ACP methyl ester carboxylesterase